MNITLDKKPAVHHTSFIAPGAVLAGEVTVGENSSVWYNAVIRADHEAITIGDATNIQDNCTLHVDPGFALSIGDRVSVGHNVILHGCSINDDCIIGMGSILMNGVSIGKNCIIGAGTLLTKGTIIPDGSVVMGSPGKVKRQLTKDELSHIESNWKSYCALSKKHSQAQ